MLQYPPQTKQKMQNQPIQQLNHPQQQQITCRICLQDMSLQQAFIVCHCKSHVHERCLTQWAKKAQKYRQSFDDYFYNCQICKDKIYLRVNKKYTCLNCRSIQFMGEQLCCTISSGAILVMGLCMFVVSLYMRLSAGNDDSEYLFDIALGCSIVIILLDLIVSGLYFSVHTDICVMGIIIKQYSTINVKKAQINMAKKDQIRKTNNHKMKINNNQLNQTQMNMVQNNEQYNIQDRFEQQMRYSRECNNIHNNEHQQQQFIPKQQQQQLTIYNNSNNTSNQSNNKSNQLVHNKRNQLVDQYQQVGHKQYSLLRSTKISQLSNYQYDTININKQLLDKKLLQSSLTSVVQQHPTNAIQVRSIICQSHLNYQTQHQRIVEYLSTNQYDNRLNQSQTNKQQYQQPNNLYFAQNPNFTSYQSQIQQQTNEINHNQLVTCMSKQVAINKNNKVHKYRNTQPTYLSFNIKKTNSLQIDNMAQDYEQQVQIYYPTNNNGIAGLQQSVIASK